MIKKFIIYRPFFQLSMNLSKPSWLTNETFEKLENLQSILWDHITFSEKLRRFSAGPIIETILSNIKNNNEKSDGGKKIYLYSGHDVNVASFTRAHNFTDIPSVPDYGSGVIVEKLRRQNKTYLKVRSVY